MAGIGSTLREARMRLHLDVSDFETRTKIRAKYLRAMEDEEWSQLPGYTFAKGFLRTYADMLGLDGRALVDEFKRQHRDPTELDVAASHGSRGEVARRARERPRDRGRRAAPSGGPGRPPIAVVMIVLVLLLAGTLYLVGVLGKSNNTATTSSTLSTTTPPQNTGATGSSHTTTPPPPTRVGVQFKPTGRVYVCLVGYPLASTSRARVRLNGILTPATHEPTYHENHFRMTLGNNSLTLRIDGHDHRFAASSSAIALSVSVDGAVSPLAAHLAPRCA
jgi:hypothetical protein